MEDMFKLSKAGQAFVDELKAGRIPERFPEQRDRYLEAFSDDASDPKAFVDNMYAGMMLKSECNAYGMWGVVDKQWTRELAEWIGERKVLEVMAGVGWLAKALDEHGVNIKATDNFSWKGKHSKVDERVVFPVEDMDAIKAAQSLQAEILLVSWPPYTEETIVQACEAWGTKRPIIYIGEGNGGCTACDEFHERFEQIDEHIHMPSFAGIHDHVQIGYWTK